jgi:hypothetical protein
MDFLTIILIAVTFFILGAAIVGLIWYLRGVSKRMRGDAKETPPEDPNLEEIASLKRHLETQELVVKMNNNHYSSFHELSPTQQRRLTFSSDVLVKWLAEPAPVPKAEVVPEAETPAQPGEIPHFEPPPVPAEPEPSQPQPGYIPPFTVDPVDEVKPVSTDLPDVVGDVLKPIPVPPPTFKSIAMQIDEILQAQLAGTALEGRGLSLSDAPDRGVRVSLDGKDYNGVMEVPDEEVRAAIRAAVLEWEKKK